MKKEERKVNFTRLQDGRRELLQELLVAEERLVVLDQSVAFGALDVLAVGGEAEVGAMDFLGYDPFAFGQLLGYRLPFLISHD